MSKGLCPLTPAWAPPQHSARGIMPLDPKLLYNIAPNFTFEHDEPSERA